jgi:citrate lyase subunit beta/citryl-CoA lyase
MLRKAPDSGADVVVFDLEDAVAPGRKAEARDAVSEVLEDVDSDSEVLVRVTPDDWATDLDRVLAGEGRPDGLLLPKVGSAEDVEALAASLDDRNERSGEMGQEDEASGENGSMPIVALIESARGVLEAPAIADTHPVTALCFGAEDLAADVGAQRTAEGTEVLYAREKVVLAAASAGIDAIDTVFTEIGETERLREETAFARGLGYDGKMAIHPAQVPVINDAFTPEPERVEWAERVLDAREQADAESRGVFRVDSEMIDAPLIAQAERIVALARAAGTDGEESGRG